MAPKRALTASQSSQTTPSQASSSAARPAKRPRVARSPPAPSSSLAAPPSRTAHSVVPETPDASLSHPAPAPSQSTQLAAPPKPPKRILVPGTLRRLSTGHPTRTTARTDAALAHPPLSSTSTAKRARVRPTASLAGAKVGGRSKDLGDRVEREELWVRRDKGKGAQGLGFAGYLKMGVGAFVERGCVARSLPLSGSGRGGALAPPSVLRVEVVLALTLSSSPQMHLPHGQRHGRRHPARALARARHPRRRPGRRASCARLSWRRGRGRRRGHRAHVGTDGEQDGLGRGDAARRGASSSPSVPLALSLARQGTDAARRVRRTRTSCTSRGPRAR